MGQAGSTSHTYKAAGKSLEEAIYGLECLLRCYENDSCRVILTSNKRNKYQCLTVTSHNKKLGTASISYTSSNKLYLVLFEPEWRWGDGYIP